MPKSTQPYLAYPVARRDDVVDYYHGISVVDPYRWLEDTAAPDTQAWVTAQQQLTHAFLETIPGRTRIKARLAELWNYVRLSVPVKAGSCYFFTRNDGLQNQDILYMQSGLDAAPVEILDPNHLSPDGTIALVNRSYSRDGTPLAYSLSHHGSDWQEIRVRQIDSRRDGIDCLRWCKFT